MIFSANPGRSGSATLASVLGHSPEIDAGHERVPAMTGPWLRRVARHGPDESYRERFLKAEAIAIERSHLASGQIYCDTSHMFVKTFADVVLAQFSDDTIAVIGLRRDPALIARSFFELGLLGPQPGNWHDWMVCPTSPHAEFRIDPAAVTGQFDLIFASLVDTHAREQVLRRRSPEVIWIDLELDELTSPGGVLRLFGQLGVRPPSPPDGSVEQTNTKSVEKAHVGLPVSTELARVRLHEFVDRFATHAAVNEFATTYGRYLG